MKIGVLAQYLDTRHDIVEIIQRLSKKHEIIVYIRSSDVEKYKNFLDSNLTVILIPDLSGFSKAISIIWQYLYLAFGRIPESRYNYYMTEQIKLLHPGLKAGQRFLLSILLILSKITPGVIDYDRYLKGLLWIKNHAKGHSGVDVFLCFTEIYHDGFFAAILEQQTPVWVYVYSWDHACKMKTFSKRVKYLVWNDGIKQDLMALQNISAKQIQVWGATQFAYINDFFVADKIAPVTQSAPYIYLGCATGYEKLAMEEVKYSGQIAAQLLEMLPEWKLLIRPYPFLKSKEVYHALSNFPNVIFDHIPFDPQDARQEKFTKIRDAQTFFHFGTTMGYEAGCFETPSFLIDFADPEKDKLLNGFVHQYQNDKYLNNGEGHNVIKSRNQLRAVLENLSRGHYGQYRNTRLQKSMELESFDTLTHKLMTFLETS